MKKILIVIAAGFSMQASSQIFSGSAKDKSSVLYQGTTLGFNLTDPSVGFSLNNFTNEKFGKEDKHFLFGLNANASATEGYANFFSGGEINSDIKADVTFGYTWTKGLQQKIKDTYGLISEELVKNIDSQGAVVGALLTAISASLSTLANEEIDKYCPAKKNQVKNTNLRSAAKSLIDDITLADFDADYKTNMLDAFPADVKFLKQLKVKLQKLLIDNYFKGSTDIKKLNDLKSQLFNARGYWLHRFTLYVAPNYVSKSFKLYELDNTNLSNSFSSTAFAGGGVNLGFNYNIGTRFLLGISGGYLRDDNSGELTSKDYVLSSTYTTTSQQLVSDKKITAKSGAYYHALDLYPVNFDAIYFFKVPQNDSTVVGVNLYLHQMFSGMKTQRPETTNIGLGVYFFSNRASKFLGGVYFEMPDINNNVAKNDPEATIRPLYKRLTFGITAKFAFSSIASLF